MVGRTAWTTEPKNLGASRCCFLATISRGVCPVTVQLALVTALGQDRGQEIVAHGSLFVCRQD